MTDFAAVLLLDCGHWRPLDDDDRRRLADGGRHWCGRCEGIRTRIDVVPVRTARLTHNAQPAGSAP